MTDGILWRRAKICTTFDGLIALTDRKTADKIGKRQTAKRHHVVIIATSGDNIHFALHTFVSNIAIKVHVNTKNRLLSAPLRHTASTSQTEEEGRGGREPVGEM